MITRRAVRAAPGLTLLPAGVPTRLMASFGPGGVADIRARVFAPKPGASC